MNLNVENALKRVEFAVSSRLAASVYSADKIVWKPIPDAILQIDARPAKIWNLFRPGRRLDPLLLQLGARSLVIYVRNQASIRNQAGAAGTQGRGPLVARIG